MYPGKPIMVVSKPTCFGEIALLRDTRRTEAVRAMCMCDVLELTRSDFRKVVRHFPVLGQKLNEQIMREAKVTPRHPCLYTCRHTCPRPQVSTTMVVRWHIS